MVCLYLLNTVEPNGCFGKLKMLRHTIESMAVTYIKELPDHNAYLNKGKYMAMTYKNVAKLVSEHKKRVEMRW